MKEKDIIKLKEALKKYHIDVIYNNNNLIINFNISEMSLDNEVENKIINNIYNLETELNHYYEKSGITSDGYEVTNNNQTVTIKNIKKVNKLKLAIVAKSIANKYQ